MHIIHIQTLLHLSYLLMPHRLDPESSYSRDGEEAECLFSDFNLLENPRSSFCYPSVCVAKETLPCNS